MKWAGNKYQKEQSYLSHQNNKYKYILTYKNYKEILFLKILLQWNT